MGEPFRGSRRTESGLAYQATARTDGEESRLVGYQAELTLPKRLMSRCDAPDMNAALHNVNDSVDIRLIRSRCRALDRIGAPARRVAFLFCFAGSAMRNGIHFISGLPRAGSTLLAALLRQNPALHAGITSPVGSLFGTMLQEVS